MSRFLLSSANSCVSIVLFVDHLLEIGMVTCSRLEIFNLPTPISNKKISNKKINTTTRLNRGPTIREIFWGCRFFFFLKVVRCLAIWSDKPDQTLYISQDPSWLQMKIFSVWILGFHVDLYGVFFFFNGLILLFFFFLGGVGGYIWDRQVGPSYCFTLFFFCYASVTHEKPHHQKVLEMGT